MKIDNNKVKKYLFVGFVLAGAFAFGGYIYYLQQNKVANKKSYTGDIFGKRQR